MSQCAEQSSNLVAVDAGQFSGLRLNPNPRLSKQGLEVQLETVGTVETRSRSTSGSSNRSRNPGDRFNLGVNVETEDAGQTTSQESEPESNLSTKTDPETTQHPNTNESDIPLHLRMRQKLPKLQIGNELDLQDEDSLVIAQANSDVDVRLHGVKTIEELEARLRYLSHEARRLDRDPILRMVRFTGECNRLTFRPDVERRHMDHDHKYYVTQYSRFSVYRNKKGLLRALDFAYKALPSAILYPGEEGFTPQDIAALRLKSHDDDAISRLRGPPLLPLNLVHQGGNVPPPSASASIAVGVGGAGMSGKPSNSIPPFTASPMLHENPPTTGITKPAPPIAPRLSSGIGGEAGGGGDDGDDDDDEERKDQFELAAQGAGRARLPQTRASGGMPPPTPSMGSSTRGRGFFGGGRVSHPLTMPPLSRTSISSAPEGPTANTTTQASKFQVPVEEDNASPDKYVPSLLSTELQTRPHSSSSAVSSSSSNAPSTVSSRKKERPSSSTRRRDEQLLLEMGVETEESPTSADKPSHSDRTTAVPLPSGGGPGLSLDTCDGESTGEESEQDDMQTGKYISNGVKLIPLGKHRTIPSMAGLVDTSGVTEPAISVPPTTSGESNNGPDTLMISPASTSRQPGPAGGAQSAVTTPVAPNSNLMTPSRMTPYGLQSPPTSGLAHQGLSFGVSPGGATTSVSSRHRKGASSISVLGLYSDQPYSSRSSNDAGSSNPSSFQFPISSLMKGEAMEVNPAVHTTLPTMAEGNEPMEGNLSSNTRANGVGQGENSDLPPLDLSNDPDDDEDSTIAAQMISGAFASPPLPVQEESFSSADAMVEATPTVSSSAAMECARPPSQASGNYSQQAQSQTVPQTTTSAQVLMMLSRPRLTIGSSTITNAPTVSGEPGTGVLPAHFEDDDDSASPFQAAEGSHSMGRPGATRYSTMPPRSMSISAQSGNVIAPLTATEDRINPPPHRVSLPIQKPHSNLRAASASTLPNSIAPGAPQIEITDSIDLVSESRRRSASGMLSTAAESTLSPTVPQHQSHSNASSPSPAVSTHRGSSSSSTGAPNVAWGALFLGSGEAAKKYDLLDYQGVRAVINCAACTTGTESAHIADLRARGIDYIAFNWHDSDIQPLLPEDVETAVRLIHKVRQTPLPPTHPRYRIAPSRPSSGSSTISSSSYRHATFGSLNDVGIARNPHGEDLPEMELSPPMPSRSSITHAGNSMSKLALASGDTPSTGQPSRTHTGQSDGGRDAPTAPSGPVLRGGSVLVHCYAGRSRSATIVVAYVAAVQGVSISTALDLVQSRRPVAQPNMNFMRQLLAMEADGLFLRLHAEFCGLPVTHHHQHSSQMLPGVPKTSAIVYSTFPVLPGRPTLAPVPPLPVSNAAEQGSSEPSDASDTGDRNMA